MFLAPNFLGEELPEFLEAIYKIDTGSDHVAKFRGDRPRELGDYVLKKKHHEHFIRPPVTPYGRPKYIKERIALHESNPITELRGVACHMGSHGVTCHPTQVNAPRLYSSQ